MDTFENISSFSLVKLKPVLMERLGMDVLFLFFSGVVLLVILLTMTIFPSEEKNKPLGRAEYAEYVRRCSSVSVL